MARLSLQNLNERLRRLRVRAGAARQRALMRIGAAVAGKIAPDTPEIIALAAAIGDAVATHGVDGVYAAVAMVGFDETPAPATLSTSPGRTPPPRIITPARS